MKKGLMPSPIDPHLPPSPLAEAKLSAFRQQRNGIIQSQHLSRRHREILLNSGNLRRIMRGWYHLRDDTAATSGPGLPLIAFLPLYLEHRLGTHWCLSAASSLAVLQKEPALPEHLVVLAPHGSTTIHNFPDGQKLTIYREENNLPTRLEMHRGLRIMAPESILARLTSSQWQRMSGQVDGLLPLVASWEGFVWQCLNEGRHQALHRLVDRLLGAGMASAAACVAQGLRAAGMALPSESNRAPAQGGRPPTEIESTPPAPLTLERYWNTWSEALAGYRSGSRNLAGNLLHRLGAIENVLPEDACHHLRLCGFPLSRAVVESSFHEPERAALAAGWPRLEVDELNFPESDSRILPGDTDPQALLALQGYAEALRLVKRSVVRMLEGRDLETILRQDMRGWRLALLGPGAEAGLVTRRQLLRYRNADMRTRMQEWTHRVAGERNAARRGLLAFLGLSWLAPWEVGNHRMALLLLNALNTAAGQAWVVIRETEAFQAAWRRALDQQDPTDLVPILSRSTLV